MMAERLHSRVDQGGGPVHGADVGKDGVGPAARLDDLRLGVGCRRRAVSVGRRTAVDDDGRALLGEEKGDGPADALARPGDEGDLAVEPCQRLTRDS